MSAPDTARKSELQYSDLSDLIEIGRGSFGRVFRADYLGTDVAVKEFLQQLPDAVNWDFDKYYGREVDMLREARHPNIVQFMGTCIQQGKVFIITEFVPGGNLKDWIAKEVEEMKVPVLSDSPVPLFGDSRRGSRASIHQSTPPRQLETRQFLTSYRLRISFAIDIARAIAYLHARGIIHRDLKLENLMLTENNRIKVCDFGFSRIVAKTEAERRRVSFCGTDGYMAPELILCMEDYDTTVDVFSYGIILLSLLVLQVPTGDGPSDNPPFRRVIPGFGLDDEELAASIPTNIPNRDKLTHLIQRCVHDDHRKRASLKETLVVLKETELAILSALHAGEVSSNPHHRPTFVNMGIPVLSPDAVSGMLSTTGSMMNIDSMHVHNESTSSSNNVSRISTGHHSPVGSPMSHGALRHITGSVDNLLAVHSTQSTPSPVASPLSATSINASRPARHNIPHRFSIVFSTVTLHTIKCSFCSKPINGFMHRHLKCDDCLYVCHNKCGARAPPGCGLSPSQASMMHMHKATSSSSLQSQQKEVGRVKSDTFTTPVADVTKSNMLSSGP